MKRSTGWLIAAVFGLLIVAAGFSFVSVRSARERAERAADQAQEVKRLAEQVTVLTKRPTVALTQRDTVQQLSGLVEQNAVACGIQQDRIRRIDAQDARRVGQTPYYRLPTRVNIEGVEMPQLIDLLARLTEGDRLSIQDCRFAAPHDEVVGSTWNAEFTLAYLVYDPQQDQQQQQQQP